MPSLTRPIQLVPEFYEKIWGTTDLDPWFDSGGRQIGEVWYSANSNQTSLGVSLGELVERSPRELLGAAVQPCLGARFPLLQKMIFTSDRLSVQVHPNDEQGRELGSPGKTEMWYVARAADTATVGLGFQKKLTELEMEEAAATGEIENLIRWVPARSGDAFFVPAGTVHAIGAGLSICEIQQNSDVTFRLWDYGRGRELHLEKGLKIAKGEEWRAPELPKDWPPRYLQGQALSSCDFFYVEILNLYESVRWDVENSRFDLLLIVDGHGRIDGHSFRPGDAWVVPATATSFRLEPEGACRILRSFVPPPRD